MLRIFFFSLIVLMIPYGFNSQAATGDEVADSIVEIEANPIGADLLEAKPVMAIPDLPTGNQQFFYLMQPVLEQHERIQGARQAVEMARETIGIAKGVRYPHLNASGQWGYRNEEKTDVEEFSDQFSNINLGIKQLLYDFGKSNASIEQTRRQRSEQELLLQQTRCQLIWDAATAYQNLHKAYMLLEYASEAEMTAGEKVETGKYEADLGGKVTITDVRELEYQLGETASQRVQREGDYQVAQNIWLEFFDALPKNMSALKPLDLSLNAELPQTIDQALEAARENNLDLRIARNKQAIVGLNLKHEKRRAFFPDINLVMDGSFENNFRDDTGNINTYRAMVELRKDINLGLTDRNRIGAAERLVEKGRYEMADQNRIVETGTRNAWQNLKTSEIYTEKLAEQATLTAELLIMARQEYESGGEKTIMDVLAGETNLINARSASYAAQIDISLAMLNLFGSMNVLDIEMFAEDLETDSPLLDYTQFLNSHQLYENVHENADTSTFQCEYDGQGGYYELFNVESRIQK